MIDLISKLGHQRSRPNFRLSRNNKRTIHLFVTKFGVNIVIVYVLYLFNFGHTWIDKKLMAPFKIKKMAEFFKLDIFFDFSIKLDMMITQCIINDIVYMQLYS